MNTAGLWPAALPAALAAGALGGAGALLLNDAIGIRNDARLVKGQAEFTLASGRHMLWQHSVADIWEEMVSSMGDKQALLFAGPPDRPPSAPVAFSFNLVNSFANRIAAFLIGQGIRAGQTIALLIPNKPEFVWSMLGAAKAGVTVSFINYNLRSAQVGHCLEICSAVAVLYDDQFEGLVADALTELAKKPASPTASASITAIKRFRYSTSLTSDASDSNSGDAAAAAGASPSASSFSGPIVNVATWLPMMSDENPPRILRTSAGIRFVSPWGFVYTSGTTGMPKAAVITHLRFFMAGYLMSAMTEITGGDRIYTVLPLYHSAGGMIGLGTMVCRGATLILSPKFSTKRFWEDVCNHEATVIQYIGELCRYLVAAPEHAKERQHHLRLAIGNGLRPDVWPKFQARFNIPAVAEFYASTEGNASLVNLCKSPADQGAVGHFGWFVRSLGLFKIAKYDDNTDALLRGKDGYCIECKPGEVGELLGYLKLDDKTGLRTFAGYHGDQKATERKIARNVFKEGDAWFRTGDLIKMSREGRYYFVDRIGDTFRWKGENVATTEVAEVLNGFPGIEEINVYGVQVPGYDGRAGMAAVVVADPDVSAEGSTPATGAAAGQAAAGSATDLLTAPVGRLPPGFDLQAFAAFARANLPAYAVPLFLRILPHVPLTSTFKHVKKDLRDEGADPTRARDELYMLVPVGSGRDASSKAARGSGAGSTSGQQSKSAEQQWTYERVTPQLWHKIVAGEARL